ncbi:serine/threonine-protein phosphatase [Pseudomonas fluorescens]|uniref:PP2C family protein-serine/threonine phosphatase n=1 Tax=Pseudomonas fluorescens TaxID=294 RepID=UPI0017845E58|nr:PP2C family serine/threonine-protein phosphatase [Pseudomonas fluorescens]MBD8190007.1 serine/threonine-protein phosphatase [Pseudomonas fluorescens]MBD8228293.1 serine/threonine-protein phosphatase [Pseudomonas fluorescens]MBD8785095.1 serine/threonine-protein phosphatase [Pseudomonas fluorescens]MBD8815141.1 serine/threonine-protein phosphatase [Pseudomonas fluorescens]
MHIQRDSAGRTLRGNARSRNEDAFLDCPQHGCWAVADGMGGHRAGDRASQWVINSLASLPGQGCLDERVEAVRRCLRWLDTQMGRALQQTAEGIMGSTVVALLLDGNRAACIWVGDSRCYLWRGQRLYQLSRDHSRLQQLMDTQQLSLEVLELGTQPGDVFLLCSDGLYQGLSHGELGNALSLGTPRQAVDRLFAQVLRGAARDDLTAVVVQP